MARPTVRSGKGDTARGQETSADKRFDGISAKEHIRVGGAAANYQ